MTVAVDKLQLTLHATRLKNVAGFFGTSDPYAEVKLLGSGSDEEPGKLLGRTEFIENSLSPEWTTSFPIDHSFGKDACIKVSIFDEVRGGSHKIMGCAVFKIEDILRSRGMTDDKQLEKDGKQGKYGILYARICKVPPTSAGKLNLALQAKNLRNVEVGKSDPFFELRRTYGGDSESWEPVYRSKVIMNNLSPEWELATIDVNALCDGDLNRKIKLAFFDDEKDGNHQALGALYTTLNELIQSEKGELIQNELETMAKFQGKICVHECKIIDAESETAGNNGSDIDDEFEQVGNNSSDNESHEQEDVSRDRDSNDTNEYQTINNVRIVSYNVLSSKLSRASHFTHSNPDHLTMKYRLPLILQKLEKEMNRSPASSSPPPTIFALQEICYSFTSELHTFFAQRGYQFITGLYGKRFNGYMGVGIAYPTEHFETVKVDICRLSDERTGGWPREDMNKVVAVAEKGRGFIQRIPIEFKQFIRNQVLRRYPVVKKLHSGFQRMGLNHQRKNPPIDPWEMSENRFNVLVSVALRHRHNSSKSSGDGTFLVSNYHMPCAFFAPPVMNIHSEMVVRRVQTLAANIYDSLCGDTTEKDIDTIPYILAGDFNILPDSPHYKLITTGSLDKSDPSYPPSKFRVDWTVEAEAMDSAYVAIGKEPEFTNYAHIQDHEDPFVGTIDYIFLSGKEKTTKIIDEKASGEWWKVKGVTKLPSLAESGEPFPNSAQPSDHLLISADLELVSK